MAVITIKDQAALTAALATARGGETFVLAAGTYSQVALLSRNFTNPITITSADPNNQAVIQDIAISKSSGINFSNLDIGSALNPGETIGVNSAAGTINNSTNVTFDHVHVHGSMDNNASNDRYGLSFRNSSNVSIKNSTFEQLTRAALFGSTNNIVVQNNTFTKLRSDGLDFSAVQNVVVDGNYFGEYSPIEGDHPDAIQFWTTGTNVASSDIVIKNNQIQFGGSQGAQGIFMRDETNKLPYKNVTIDNNMIYVVAGYNGLAVGSGENVTVTNNTVLSKGQDKYKLRISLGDIQGGTVANNVADYLLTTDKTNVTVGNNLLLQDEAAKIALIPNTSNGAATTYKDLVVAGIGYQPTSGAGLGFKPSPEVIAAAAAANIPKVAAAGTVLLDISFNGGVATDTSAYKSKVSIFNAADLNGSGDSATYKLGGKNYFEVAKASASQLYDLSAFTLSFNLQRESAAATSDGSIMRVHNSWYLSESKGELTLQFVSTNGTTYKVSSKGANLTDVASHKIDMVFDGSGGSLTFYVDGQSVGGGAIAGATKGPASWGLDVGNPFGDSFRGQVGGLQLTAGAKSAAAVADTYMASLNMEDGSILAPAPTVYKSLLDLNFTATAATDASAYGSKVATINASDLINKDGSLEYKLGGKNYFEVTKNSASQLYGLSKFTLSFDLQRDTVAASSDGYLMRIHNSWYLGTNKGELVFTYNSSNGTTYKVTSKGANLTDLASHEVDVAFDATAGQLSFYVDGKSVGSGAIAGATKARESWGLAVGNPFGDSFKGEIGSIDVAAGTKTATDVALEYQANSAMRYALADQRSLTATSLGDTLAAPYATASMDSASSALSAPTTAGYLATSVGSGPLKLDALLAHA